MNESQKVTTKNKGEQIKKQQKEETNTDSY